MKDVKIVATNFAVPEHIVTNNDLSKIMDTSDEWIVKRTGIKRRYISQKENTSDLATQVAIGLLKKSSVSAQDIDLIIVATMSPDNMTPATAAMVQGRIGAENAVCFDISAACSGFSYAVSLARGMMLTNHLQNAIVIGAKVLSKLLDWTDRSTAVLFGDGAGGVLLEQTNTKHFLGQSLRTFGNKGDRLVAGYLGVTDDVLKNKRKSSAFTMNGQEVYRFATHEVPRSILKACSDAQVELEQIDHFLLHQANSRIIAQVAKKLKQPLSKFAIDIDEYGNTAAASELKPKKDQNDQVAIINFIVLDNNGKQLTSSGPLTGKPGESINDLYSTEIPLKAIAQTGYHVVFNGFDGDGQIQKFNNNDLMTQVFTVGLSKSAKSETKAKAPEKQSDVDLDAVREATINNKDTAAMALGIAATIISLIGLIGKENK